MRSRSLQAMIPGRLNAIENGPATGMQTSAYGNSRLNTPDSIAATNWTQRLPQTVKQFDADPGLHAKTKTFSHLAQKSGRTF
jgi:4-alpha-glucanotransferase